MVTRTGRRYISSSSTASRRVVSCLAPGTSVAVCWPGARTASGWRSCPGARRSSAPERRRGDGGARRQVGRRRPGVKSQLLVAGADQLSFHCGELAQSRLQRLVVAAAIAVGTLREPQIQLEMARFGVLQAGVESAQRLRQPRRQQREALAGARLNQRGSEQQVEF